VPVLLWATIAAAATFLLYQAGGAALTTAGGDEVEDDTREGPSLLEQVTGYVKGVAAQIEVMAIGGGFYLRVDAAQSWLRLKAFADSQGMPLKVNSAFRWMEEQIQLYQEHLAGTRPQAVAAPGKSNHQSGFAVDVEVGGSTGTPTYRWLDRMAPTYGWTNVGINFGEPWHWEYNPAKDGYV
jgi:hypothetical protein